MRERLPDERYGVNHKLVLHSLSPSGEMGKLNIYITMNRYPDGRLGELFYTVNVSGKESETVEGKTADILYYECLRGWLKQWAIAISLCLQSGVTLAKLVDKFAFQDFPPSGFTENKTMHSCKSIVDYTIRWMECEFKSKKG